MAQNMRQYLTDLITEKGYSIEDEIGIEGQIGLTYEILIEFIEQVPEYHNTIRTTLVKIDFNGGNVFHYLKYLAAGMVSSIEQAAAQ